VPMYASFKATLIPISVYLAFYYLIDFSYNHKEYYINTSKKEPSAG
jgi:hypothetical protein